MIDFNKLALQSSKNKVISPRDIFSTLTDKKEKYAYLRDVQTEVLNKWFKDRDLKDTVIKMNTGSGKTVVALLVLKSCLEEGKGPAVYITPDNYLKEQVLIGAEELGIEVTTDEKSPRFASGKAILVTNIYKLINGRSYFGVDRIKNRIGSIIIDDAHACIETTESQFTLEVPRNVPHYYKLFSLFSDSLKEQGQTKVLEIEDGYYGTNIEVPFWTWRENHEEIIKILHDAHVNDTIDNIVFKWPLIKGCLEVCNCVVNTHCIEISPPVLPIDVIPSFFEADRRIFMTATLADDSILTSHFNVDLENSYNIITPEKANDIGERMIIAPQAINPDIEEEELKEFLKDYSKEKSVVVIVPSNQRYKFWEDVADNKLTSENLLEGVEELKENKCGLTVLVNKYDGVDLPREACHILVIDGVPKFKRKVDEVKEAALQGSEDIQNTFIQKIEQGMGRGVRSTDDYCVILLMGDSLINRLYNNNAKDKFTNATKKQFELSDSLADQIQGQPLNELKNVMSYCLERDNNWKQVSRNNLLDVEYSAIPNIRENIKYERKAFEAFRRNDYYEAIKLINEVKDKTNDKYLKGWLTKELAKYKDFIDPVEAQEILKTASKSNTQLLKPKKGIEYSKLLNKQTDQAHAIVSYLDSNNFNQNSLIMKANEVCSNLKFEGVTSTSFEVAFKEVAVMLGYLSQRPEKEYGRGPDVLWELEDNQYLVIECKNEAVSHIIGKRDCNQLTGSIEWFKTTYGPNLKYLPLMIHPHTVFEFSASPNENVRIIDYECLEKFKKNFKEFISAIISEENFKINSNITRLLKHYNFNYNGFIKNYTKPFRREKK